jgi:uncharacterized protein YjbI with pentapeptide repeats
MIKTKQYLLAALLINFSLALHAESMYTPNDLAKFNATNGCDSCDLSGAYLTGNHSKAVISNSNLTGAIGIGTFSAVNFTGSNLSSSNWSSANLSYANFAYIDLISVNFSGTNLVNAIFDGANTTNAIFDNAILYGSNISQDQLNAAKSYCGAVLPDGTVKNC